MVLAFKTRSTLKMMNHIATNVTQIQHVISVVIGHECVLLQSYKGNFMKLYLLKFVYQFTTSYRLAAIMNALPFVGSLLPILTSFTSQ